MSTHGHPPADQLSAFLAGKLSRTHAVGVEAHLSCCPSCAESLQALPDDRLVMLVRSAVTPVPAAPGAT